MTAQVIPLPVRLSQHRSLDALPGLAEGVQVRFHPSMPHHVQRLMGTLGARVVFDETVAPGEAWNEHRGGRSGP